MGRCCLMVAALALGVAGAAPAVGEQIVQRPVSDAEAMRWRAVGSLQVAGHQACTAVLISELEAITAAHCVVDRATGQRVALATFSLVLGQRADGFAAVRGVAAAAFPPEYVSLEPISGLVGLSPDIALLQLDAPVTADEAAPKTVVDWPNPIGAFVDIVGYERDGPMTATIREGCMAVETGDGVTVVTCDVISGLSGAPVLLSENPAFTPHLVASVSSRGQGAAFVVTIAPGADHVQSDSD